MIRIFQICRIYLLTVINKHSLMKKCEEVSHDNDDRLRERRDDSFDLSGSLCLVLYF